MRFEEEGRRQRQRKHGRQEHKEGLREVLHRRRIQLVKDDRRKDSRKRVQQTDGAQHLADALGRDMLADGRLEGGRAQSAKGRDDGAGDKHGPGARKDVSGDTDDFCEQGDAEDPDVDFVRAPVLLGWEWYPLPQPLCCRPLAEDVVGKG